jgi:hypothetical protein
MKLDMHVHTKYSPDSYMKIKTLRKICLKLDITPIITDHNQIKGNLAYKCPILASEISTKEGHIIGYFINEKIKPYLPALEVIEKIHEQGGLACIPHPFDLVRKKSAIIIQEIIKKADLIEAFNGRVIKQKYNRMAQAFARNHKIPMTVGTDSHFKYEVGKSYIEIEDFNSVKEFIKNIKKGNLFTTPGKPEPLLATYLYKNSIGRLIK